MTTLTVKVPDGKTPDVADYIKKIGGEVVKSKKSGAEPVDEDDEVTHEQYFGENIKRAIKAFSK